MKKLLLLLPLISLTCGAPSAHAYDMDVGIGEMAAQDYVRHATNAAKFKKMEDYKMMCGEHIKADLQLQTWFKQLQKAHPEWDWFESRVESKKAVEWCNSSGYY